MSKKYFCLLLIACFVLASMFICTGCDEKKQTSINIKYESKSSRIKNVKQKVKSNVIDLSEGKKNNYNYNLGPQDPSGPSFNLVTVGSH